MAKKAITKLSELTPDANNYNKGTEFGGGLIEKSLRKLGAGRSILLDKNGKVIAGNKTLENAVNAGFGDEDLIVVQTTGKQIVAVQRMDLDLDSKMGKEMALADNATAKANIEWDTEALNADWSSDELNGWGVQAWGEDVQEQEKEEDNNYSKKVEAPIYEPKNEKPDFVSLLNQERTQELISEIQGSNISEAEKDFLTIAAQRHTVFNYERIADFYAHSTPDVQRLMENSALVIIDFQKAIELGYVQLSEEISKLYDEEYPDEE